MAMALIWLLLLPIRQAARSGRRAGGIELLFEILDVGIDQLPQFGNLHGQLVGADLILLHGGLGGMAGVRASELAAAWMRSEIDAGAPSLCERQMRSPESARLMPSSSRCRAERCLVELGRSDGRGVDGALDGIEARAGFGGGLLRGA